MAPQVVQLWLKIIHDSSSITGSSAMVHVMVQVPTIVIGYEKQILVLLLVLIFLYKAFFN